MIIITAQANGPVAEHHWGIWSLVELLDLQNLNVVEDENGVYVKGLSSHVAQTEEEALNLLFEVRTWEVIWI